MSLVEELRDRSVLPQPSAYHDKAMLEAATEIEMLREVLNPFARLAVIDDRLSGLDPQQIRHHVAMARSALDV